MASAFVSQLVPDVGQVSYCMTAIVQGLRRDGGLPVLRPRCVEYRLVLDGTSAFEDFSNPASAALRTSAEFGEFDYCSYRSSLCSRLHDLVAPVSFKFSVHTAVPQVWVAVECAVHAEQKFYVSKNQFGVVGGCFVYWPELCFPTDKRISKSKCVRFPNVSASTP